MKRERIIYLACALVVPIAGWLLAAARDDRGLVPIPFGDLPLLVVHAAAVLPLAWLLSGLRTWPPRGKTFVVLGALVLSLWPAMLPPSAFTAATREVIAFDSHYFVRYLAWLTPVLLHLIRLCYLFVPQLAWCIAARMEAATDEAPQRRFATIMVAALVAIVPTASYAHHRLAQLKQQSEHHASQQRTWRAWLSLEQVAAIHGGDRDPLRGAHAARVGYLALKLQTPPSPSDPLLAMHIDQLMELEQLHLARSLLPPSSQIAGDSGLLYVAMQLAMRQGRWAEAEMLAGRVSDGKSGEQLVWKHEWLAEVYRAQHRWPEAEALYLRMIQEQPTHAKFWHQQLARHYELSGRPQRAIEYYEQSATSELYAYESRAAIDRLRMTTPACMFSSGYAQPLGK